MTEGTHPTRRRPPPTRPHKAPSAEPTEPHSKAKFASDERVGTRVDDPSWNWISFPDGRQYRIEDGVIAERMI